MVTANQSIRANADSPSIPDAAMQEAHGLIEADAEKTRH
jgi:hypothetical protein